MAAKTPNQGERHLTDTQQQQILLCLTTEHSALQSARSTTVYETNGRITLFLSTVSSALIALGFIGQTPDNANAFVLFGAVLFPVLLFIGIATFVRVLQATGEDLLYGRGINRIRHFYQELAPQMAGYFILSAHDDIAGVLGNMSLKPSPWQLLFTGAGMVAVINSVIAGVVVGVVIVQLIGLGLLLKITCGAIAFLASLLFHLWYQQTILNRADQHIPVLFPSGAKDRQAQTHQ